MQVISTEKRPIKLWLDDIEDGALKQAKNLANLPFIHKHVAIMPDSHQGYGMPIGGVIATKGVIIPNAVGVDIGCGMCAVKTSLTEIDTESLKNIMGKIREAIPVGFNHHSNKQNIKLMPHGNNGDWWERYSGSNLIIEKEFDHARTQIGTLGGGNHFIEIQKGSDGHIWIMLHSGSRNLGYRVADHYNKLAMELNTKWYTSVPAQWQLAFLPLRTQEAYNYNLEMQYCIDFALANRKLMMDNILNIFLEETDSTWQWFAEKEMINIAHNYAVMENHFGKNVMVHRKGATLARDNTIGIIPGSQGTKSYIVKGKGNPDSFMSCSHGAGRTMSRTKAKQELDLEQEKKILDDLGVIHSIRNVNNLDEAPSAYKDIGVVMDNQSDLVDILVELLPLAVIKG